MSAALISSLSFFFVLAFLGLRSSKKNRSIWNSSLASLATQELYFVGFFSAFSFSARQRFTSSMVMCALISLARLSVSARLPWCVL
jgi:hypothetical protein